MFDLRESKAGDLAPDEPGTLGYFVLEGAREKSELIFEGKYIRDPNF